MISEDDIDSFILELSDYIEQHPLLSSTQDGEGFDHLREFVFQRFDKFWSSQIKERNYN